jgi:hypothetical protein
LQVSDEDDTISEDDAIANNKNLFNPPSDNIEDDEDYL